MSMKYHPDKNPNGREKFQSITKAYQFLCNRSKLSRGPNRLHIQLMLRAQSIVYRRYRPCKSSLFVAFFSPAAPPPAPLHLPVTPFFRLF
ncbi:unnamed protein product [Trichobilharzia regenti]|nr:unnamed protein product [Trichobilharzia regenti]